MKKVVLWLSIALQFTAAHAAELKMPTDNGFVAFTTGDDWQVSATETAPWLAATVFQIPRGADADSSDSTGLRTGLSIFLYSLSSEQGRDAFAKVDSPLGGKAPAVETIGAWSVFRHEGPHGATNYTVLDAKCSEIDDVAVKVRLVWPHLTSNPAGYDRDMEALFRTFLSSIHGNTGPCAPKDGGAARRPEG